MNKNKSDAYAYISISPKEAIDGCIHKLQINDESPIDLVIPPGIRHEQIMRLTGKGIFQPQTGRRGDLYLTILIEKEARASKISVGGYSSGTRMPRNKHGPITAGVGIVLAGALGVIAQYADQNRLKPISSNSGTSQESTSQSKESSSPPDTESTVSRNSAAEIEQNTNSNAVDSGGKKFADSQNNDWDDQTINSESLDELCRAGVFGNSVNGRGWGYMQYIFQGRLTLGNTTMKDYRQLKQWFANNCPDGW